MSNARRQRARLAAESYERRCRKIGAHANPGRGTSRKLAELQLRRARHGAVVEVIDIHYDDTYDEHIWYCRKCGGEGGGFATEVDALAASNDHACCLACPQGCYTCSRNESTCECYEHQNDHPDAERSSE